MGLSGIAELLIRRGADVNVRDSYGRTPLHEAAGSRDEESGRVILSNFPINVHIYGVVTLLISKGADVNARDKRGKTPMDVALGNGNVPAVFALHPHGPALEEFLRSKVPAGRGHTGEELWCGRARDGRERPGAREVLPFARLGRYLSRKSDVHMSQQTKHLGN